MCNSLVQSEEKIFSKEKLKYAVKRGDVLFEGFDDSVDASLCVQQQQLVI